jgi:hypothetical protein
MAAYGSESSRSDNALQTAVAEVGRFKFDPARKAHLWANKITAHTCFSRLWQSI